MHPLENLCDVLYRKLSVHLKSSSGKFSGQRGLIDYVKCLSGRPNGLQLYWRCWPRHKPEIKKPFLLATAVAVSLCNFSRLDVTFLSLYLPISPSMYISLHLCTYLSFYVHISPSMYISLHLCTYLSFYVHFSPSMYISLLLCTYLAIYVHTSPSMYLCYQHTFIYINLPIS